VTKANVVKTTDGRFLDNFYRIAKDYPGIQADDWYIDIMTAKLMDEKRRREFQVLCLPNLYGDILTDEAAEFQGGVGTAGSANIGKRYAMFEAIHGSAPRMVQEGRAAHADPASMIRAAAMLVATSVSRPAAPARGGARHLRPVRAEARRDGPDRRRFGAPVRRVLDGDDERPEAPRALGSLSRWEGIEG